MKVEFNSQELDRHNKTLEAGKWKPLGTTQQALNFDHVEFTVQLLFDFTKFVPFTLLSSLKSGFLFAMNKKK